MKQSSDYIDIDLGRLALVCLKKWWLIVTATILFGAAAFGTTRFFITPTYESTVKIYVNNSDINVGNLAITASDLTASRSLVDVYKVILNTKDTLDIVIERAGVEYDYKQLMDMLDTSTVNDTQVFEVAVTSTSAKEAELIASTIGNVLPDVIAGIIESADARIVEHAVVPTDRTAPDYSRNTVIGAGLGLLIAVLFLCVRELINDKIRAEDDIVRITELPILAYVPSSDAYGHAAKEAGVLCEQMSFMAAENYKMLRTKLGLIIPKKHMDKQAGSNENDCRIIGITSALRAEGKTTTAVNLSYTLAEAGHRVCIIEADMRLPNLAELLNLKKTPGLSNALTGQSPVKDSIQRYKSTSSADFSVVAAGDIPPLPSELLESKNMKKLLSVLSSIFDYIIIDLPPINVVTDALSISRSLDGMLMIARKDYCDRHSFQNALDQFKLTGTKMLGIVFNCYDGPSGRSEYYKNRKYYKNSTR